MEHEGAVGRRPGAAGPVRARTRAAPQPLSRARRRRRPALGADRVSRRTRPPRTPEMSLERVRGLRLRRRPARRGRPGRAVGGVLRAADAGRRRTSPASRSCASSPTAPTSRSASAGRTWIPAQGPARTSPTARSSRRPLETSVEGTISFTYPAVFQGREVEARHPALRGRRGRRGARGARPGLPRGDDRRWTTARGGRASSRSASTTASPRSRGTSCSTRRSAAPSISRSARRYPESGGLNRSALHWDMICDLRTGSEVYADGELVYRDGRFVNGISS